MAERIRNLAGRVPATIGIFLAAFGTFWLLVETFKDGTATFGGIFVAAAVWTIIFLVWDQRGRLWPDRLPRYSALEPADTWVQPCFVDRHSPAGTRRDIEQLTRLAQRAHPGELDVDVRLLERRFSDWFDVSNDVFEFIVLPGEGGHERIGYSCILPLKPKAHRAYRRCELNSWELRPDHLDRDSPLLLYQFIGFDRALRANSQAIRQAYLTAFRHLARFRAASRQADILAKANTPEGERLVHRFHFYARPGRDGAGYGIQRFRFRDYDRRELSEGVIDDLDGAMRLLRRYEKKWEKRQRRP